jgi:hypothetical protein
VCVFHLKDMKIMFILTVEHDLYLNGRSDRSKYFLYENLVEDQILYFFTIF